MCFYVFSTCKETVNLLRKLLIVLIATIVVLYILIRFKVTTLVFY